MPSYHPPPCDDEKANEDGEDIETMTPSIGTASVRKSQQLVTLRKQNKSKKKNLKRSTDIETNNIGEKNVAEGRDGDGDGDGDGDSDGDGEGYDQQHEDQQHNSASALPGAQTVFLKTFGCSHNVSDSEYMGGILESYGYKILGSKEGAQVWVINSCTVKDPSQAAFMNMVKEAKDKNIPIVVAGCVPQGDRKIKGLEDVSVVGVLNIDRIVEAVEQTIAGNTVRLLSKSSLPSLDLPKIRRNPFIEIIPLSTGCLGNCTYCKTKHARGKLGSYRPEAIVKRARQAVEEGVMEIWLSSEDTGAYGIDLGTSLAKLLKLLIDALPDTVMLRIGMTNPPFILNQLDDIAAALNHPRVFSFLHVPVQSGSDHVLTGMNREYSRLDFDTVADHLLKHVPGVTIATDIICGFPNEREEDFEETMELMEKYRLHITNISQFYPRPGTPAAKMKRISTKIVKNRSRRISAFFNTFTPYVDLVGKKMGCWVGLESDKNDIHIVGHTKNYTKVLLPFDGELKGCYCEVTIETAERFHVVGSVVGGTVRRLVRLPSVEKDDGKGEFQNALLQGAFVGGCGEPVNNPEEEKKLEAEGMTDGGNDNDCCGTEGGCGGGSCSAESNNSGGQDNSTRAPENMDNTGIVGCGSENCCALNNPEEENNDCFSREIEASEKKEAELGGISNAPGSSTAKIAVLTAFSIAGVALIFRASMLMKKRR